MTEPTGDAALRSDDAERSRLLFTQMVFQLSGLASMLLGRMPHPETGETQRDLASAQAVIDQLEMLETKTRGNLDREEEHFLKQTLTGLRMAYVEAVNQPESANPPADAAPAEGGAAPAAPDPEAPPAPESKKKFTKRY